MSLSEHPGLLPYTAQSSCSLCGQLRLRQYLIVPVHMKKRPQKNIIKIEGTPIAEPVDRKKTEKTPGLISPNPIIARREYNTIILKAVSTPVHMILQYWFVSFLISYSIHRKTPMISRIITNIPNIPALPNNRRSIPGVSSYPGIFGHSVRSCGPGWPCIPWEPQKAPAAREDSIIL